MQSVNELIKKTPSTYLWGAGVVALLCIVVAIIPARAPDPVLRMAPNVPLSLLYSGEDTTLHDLIKGKPAVINAWASWCPFCVHELPDLIELQKLYRDEVVVVGINRSESVEEAKTYLSSIGAEDGITYVRDHGDLWYAASGGYVMPETTFVYADGRIAKHKRGPITLEDMKHYTQLLLENKPFETPSTTPAIEHVKGCTEEGQCIF